MAKKIYWETIKKRALQIGIPAGVAGFSILFMYLFFLGVIDVSDYSDDMICQGTEKDPCIALINFSVKEDIFIYPIGYDPWGRETPFETDRGLKEWHMYRSWGKSWREIRLDQTCTATWCGAPPNSPDNKYSFAFREGREYQIKIIAHKENPLETIKWGFGPVDPFWYGINDTADISVSENLTLELDNQINISTNITGCNTVCVDIDHPEYGDNYTCGSPTANFLFNISYFRKTELNDSNVTYNITYTSSPENQTVHIRAHQYDEILNASLNLTGFNYSKINIYINNSLSNNVREVSDDIITIYSFGDNYLILSNVTNASSGINSSGYCTTTNCSEAYDGDWGTYARRSVDVNISINHSIPSYYINKSYVNWKYAWCGGTLVLSCYDGDTLVEIVDSYESDCYIYNNTLTLPRACYDGEDEVQLLYQMRDEGYMYESEIWWYEGGRFVDFTEKGTEIVTFDLPGGSDTNITNASWVVWGYSSEDNLDQSMSTIASGYPRLLVEYTTAKGQSFTPAYSDLSKAEFLLYHLGFASADIDVKIGTTINGSEVGSGIIDSSDLPMAGAEWISVDLDYGLTVGNLYYLTLTGDPSELVYWVRSDTETSPYVGGNAVYKVGGVSGNWTFDMNFKTYVDKFPENITIEVGDIDGIYEWNYTGEFSSSDQTDDVSAPINSYLSDCSLIDNYCSVPIYITSVTPGTIALKTVVINYTVDPNPVYLDVNLISSFLNSSSGFADIPITFENTENGTLGISDIRFDYLGGNDTIEILTFNATATADKTVNDTLDLIVYYSSFVRVLPYDWTTAIFFLPKTTSSKNVSAYGQTSSIPIFNITTTNYGGMNLNLSAKLNESFSCLNVTISTNSSKTDGELFRDLCYQETATTATDCGGLDGGAYDTIGLPWYNLGKAYDGDWSTYSYKNFPGEGSLYINYSQPKWTVLNGTLWEVKHGLATKEIRENISVIEDCLIQDPVKFKVTSNADGSSFINGTCWDGSAWTQLFYDSGSNSRIIWEEALWWNMLNWRELSTNVSYLSNIGLWMWADLDNCNASERRILRPEIQIESYCKNCVWEGQ